MVDHCASYSADKDERQLLCAPNTKGPSCFLPVIRDEPSITAIHHLSNYSTSFAYTGPHEGQVVAFAGDASPAGKILPALLKAPKLKTSQSDGQPTRRCRKLGFLDTTRGTRRTPSWYSYQKIQF
jgi:hypothetical protein